MLPTIEWRDGAVVMVDQRKLPSEEVYVECRTATEVAKAIKTMVIRGAPAIGVAAAMGLALGVETSKATGTQKLADRVLQAVRADGGHAADGGQPVLGDRPDEGVVRRRRRRRANRSNQIKARLIAEARAIHDEDVASCRAIGGHGAEVVPDGGHVLTHCNAGALATAGYGTALGVIRGAIERGKKVAVFADETRPFLQGARLTAWELVKDGIDTTVITESMAAPLMRDGRIDLVVVGADRIAANGDTANKVGHIYRGARGARAQRAVLRGRAGLDDRPRDAGGPADSHRGAAGARSDAREGHTPCSRKARRSSIPPSTSPRTRLSPASSPSAASRGRPTSSRSPRWWDARRR